MGFCFSCCRRTVDEHDDREPLLPRYHDQSHIPYRSRDPLPPPRTSFDKLADIVAALHAGKLPSQEQVNRALRHALTSDLLNPESYGGLGHDHGARTKEQEELEETGRNVLHAIREASQALLEFGMEKNDDDRIQEIVYHIRNIDSTPVHADVAVETTQPINVDVDTIAQQVPSQEEANSDAAALLRSVYTLVYTLATSAAFRLILTNVLLIARETVADVAGRIEQVAAVVEKAAEDVEQTVRPGGGTLDDVKGKAAEVSEKATEDLAGHGPVSENVSDILEKVRQESPDELRAAIIRRLQEAVARAHRQPSFQAAFRTILALSRKYAAKVRMAADVASTAQAPDIRVTPVVWADPMFARALKDLKILLERISSGRSLDALFDALGSLVSDIVTAPADVLSESPNKAAMRDWFASLGEWLDSALADADYATSRIGQVRIEVLYDDARRIADEALSDPDSQWVKHLRTLLGEVEAFVANLRADRTTGNLVQKLEDLVSAVAAVGTSTAPKVAREKVERARRDAWKGLVLWLLPRVMRVVSAIPMPRVEFVSETIEAAVDALLLTAPRARDGEALRGETLGVQTSLLPDRVRVESWNELVVEVDTTAQDSEQGEIHPKSPGSWMDWIAGTGHSRDRPFIGHTATSNPTSHTRTRTTTMTWTRTRAKIHVEGIRVSSHDVAYYVHYKGARCCGVRLPCTAYEDEGLVSVDVGMPSSGAGSSSPDPRGTGLSLDIELEFESGKGDQTTGWMAFFGETGANSDGHDEASFAPLFKVTSVHVDVPGLDVALAQSKHWILNALVVQPLAGPVARAAVGWVLGGQVRAALEAFAEMGGRVRAGARKQAVERRRRDGTGGVVEDREDDSEVEEVGAEDWWDALAAEVGMSRDAQEDDPDNEGDEDDENEPLVETHTRATMQGIVRTTVTQASPSAEPGESVLAVGIGAQVLPGKGGPYGASAPEVLEDIQGVQVRGREEARDALQDVEAAGKRLEEAVREGVGRAVREREEVEEAGTRGQVRTRIEREQMGWRSSAFGF
ncbi:hypothetical protein C8Q76DRAFT_706217 [Earliella scabrosa]|nr:hypothetical protein C8Q76DRAFT_706217 [Earliella scabrosa]